MGGLVTCQPMESREFALQDEQAEICARLDVQDPSSRFTFYDRVENEGLGIGLRGDAVPGFR